MPKRHCNMKGGFLDSIGSTLSGWGNSLSQGASSAWNKTKNAFTGTPTYTSPTYTGGRRCTRKHYKGGYRGNTNIAISASPYNKTKGGYGGNRDIALSAAPYSTMKGGYAGIRDIGYSAAPVENIKTTQVHWLGGGYAQPEWLAYRGNNNSNSSFKGGKSKRKHNNKSHYTKRRH